MTGDVAKAMAEAAAQRLTGHYVEVRLQRPPAPYDDCDGIAHRSGEHGVIYVAPDLDADRWIYVFCHEAAHVKQHWRTMPPVATGAALPAPSSSRSIGAAKAQALRENEADELAARWLERVRPYDTPLAKLVALAILGGGAN